jgi:predicted neutral ceramidase superfamily lipid hydrolase
VNLIFLKKWFTGFGTGLPVIPTGKPILPIGLLVSVNFNHCRSIDLLILVPVYRSYQSVNRSYRPVYRFSTSQMQNLNSERFSTGFIGFCGNRSYRWRAAFEAISIFRNRLVTVFTVAQKEDAVCGVAPTTDEAAAG